MRRAGGGAKFSPDRPVSACDVFNASLQCDASRFNSSQTGTLGELCAYAEGESNCIKGWASTPAFVFDDVIFLIITLVAIWSAGRVVKALGAPALIGHVVFGMLLGPNGTDFAPKPDALMLAGEVGLMLLVLEAGLDVDFDMLKKVGGRAVGVAVSGSLVPMGIGAALSFALGLDWKAALSVGVVLAPTSVGIALNVLSSAQLLNTETGQLIIAAAILDDVIALVLLSALQALENPTAMALLKPILVSAAWLIGIGALSLYVVPPSIKVVLERVPHDMEENFVLLLVFLLAVGIPPAVHHSGSSHLLGAFLAGLLFCSEHHAHHAWVRQVKRLMAWLLTVFFATTVGFAIPPIGTLFKGEVIKFAAVFFIAILGKVGTGVWAMPLTKPNFFVVGFAMSAWGEFAFIVASAAKLNKFIDEETFSACILAVLLSVLMGPLMLRLAVSWKSKHDAVADLVCGDTASEPGDLDGYESFQLRGLSRSGSKEAADDWKREAEQDLTRYPVHYICTVECFGRPGQQNRIHAAFSACSCEVLDFRAYHSSREGGALAYEAEDGASKLRHNMILELAVADEECCLPIVAANEADRETWVQRHKQVQVAIDAALEDADAKVVVERWIPGMIEGHMIHDEDWADEHADVGAAPKNEQHVDLVNSLRAAASLPPRSSAGKAAAAVGGATNGDGDGDGAKHGAGGHVFKPPSRKTVFVHADIELRKRFAARARSEHGAAASQVHGHGFHYSHTDKEHGISGMLSGVTRKEFDKVIKTDSGRSATGTPGIYVSNKQAGSAALAAGGDTYDV